MARYVVFGAGAVGGTIAGRLHRTGRDVTVIARGTHLEAIRHHGLEVGDPDGTHLEHLPAVGEASEVAWHGDEVVVLAVKTQDTPRALDGLALAVPPSIPIVCAQNGVENERLALRHFSEVYAMCVMLPATHLVPGAVWAHSAPLTGILDVGRYPSGVDDVAATLAGDLSDSSFDSAARPDVMRWKYAKLLLNLGNSLEAACGAAARSSPLYAALRSEGDAVLSAAGIDRASDEEDRQRRGGRITLRAVAGHHRAGGSSWQSLARGAGTIEADHLNGEIVLLGRLHGVPTPANALLQRVAGELARRRAAPGSLTVSELEAQLG